MDNRVLLGAGAFAGFAVAAAGGEGVAWGLLLGSGLLWGIFAGHDLAMAEASDTGDGSSGGGSDEAGSAGPPQPGAPGGSGVDVDTKIWAAIAYAKKYGYSITDRGGYISPPLMACDPMGAVALHATLGKCAWSYCDIPQTAAGALGQNVRWVQAFHDGFKQDSYNEDLPDVYAIGQSYRQQILGGG